jgi:hypothetical protein
MADTFRYRYGDTTPVMVAYKALIAVQIGDMVYTDAADGYTVKPAASLPFAAGLADPVTGPTAASAASTVGVTQFATANYTLKYTYVYPWGESLPSNGTVVAMTAGQQMTVTGLAVIPPTPVIAVNWYCMTGAGGATPLALAFSNDGGGFILGGPPGVTAQAIPTVSLGGALAQTQYNFAQSFLGISAQRWDGTNLTTGSKDGTLRIDTAGVFEMDCAAASSFNPGDLVGPDTNAGVLFSQQVVKVTSKALAIGRVEKLVAAVNKVKVRLATGRLSLPSLA